MIKLNFGIVEGLPEEEQGKLNYLERIYKNHQVANIRKRRYYEGKISLSEVNLGIAIPHKFSKLNIGCAWGAKTVDVLAGRSKFDGFVSERGDEAKSMTDIVKRNRLIAQYEKACRDELLYGSTFAAVSGSIGDATVRFYSPKCAAATWDNTKGRIDCGFAFEDSKDDESNVTWEPMYVSLFTETDTWELNREEGHWIAERYPHGFERPMLEPMTWNASSDKPFGQSRIKNPIRKLIQGYVRTVCNATIGLEFATSPQKYLLGVTDEQYDALINNKFQQYAGNLLAATQNPETGQNPDFGQLTQGNIAPHVEMLRILATQFSAATGLTVTDTGVVNDANPTSSDAILAQTQTLVTLAEQLNQGNADALNQIAQMALAVEQGTTPDALSDNDKNVIAHFKNPAMPSIAQTADAAIKIASARQGFANTDIFLEMVGFSQADIRRIKAQEARYRGQQTLASEINGLNQQQTQQQATQETGDEETEPATGENEQ